MKTTPIKNPAARIWTRSELKKTCTQAHNAGYVVQRDDDMTNIINPENGDVVLRSLYNGSRELVRIDKSYFELF